MTKNIFYLDVLRVLATLAVIMIHVTAPYVVSKGSINIDVWLNAKLINSISRFCIPMFFMISGGLLLSKKDKTKDFLKKRVIKIIPPFVFWFIVYLAVKVIYLEGDFSYRFYLGKIIRSVIHGAEYHFWFIYTLIGIYLFTPIIKPWIQRASKNEILYFILIWIVSNLEFIPLINEYLIDVELIYFSKYLGYYVLGYFLINYDSLSRISSLFLLILGLITTILYSGCLYNINYFSNYFSINILMLSVGLISLVKKIRFDNKVFNKLIIILSKNSFGIYFVHPLIIFFLGKTTLSIQDLNFLLFGLIVFIISFCTTFFLKKTLLFKYLIG